MSTTSLIPSDLVGRLTVPVWSDDPDEPTAAKVLDLSRGSAYAAVRRGDIPVLRFGSRVVVPVAKLLELVGIAPETSEAPLASSASPEN